MTEGWVDQNEGWVAPDELGPRDEVLARLRGVQQGDLQAFLSPLERREQGMEPEVLPVEVEKLARDLLDLPADAAIVERVLQEAGVDRARAALHQVVAEWNMPDDLESLWLYLSKQQDGVTWVLERIAIGVTAVQVDVSIATTLSDQIPYRVFFPIPGTEELVLEPWWDIFAHMPLAIADDLGTPYQEAGAQARGGFPLRVSAGGQADARAVQRYMFTFALGVPPSATNLTVSGTIDLAIEEPFTASPPWTTRAVSLGGFQYSIDLEGWWPDVIRPRVSDCS